MPKCSSCDSWFDWDEYNKGCPFCGSYYESDTGNYNFNNESRVIDRTSRYDVLKRQKWRCNFCNTMLKWDKNSNWEGETAHIDHIHPYTKRDSYINGVAKINELENLQALCPKCNLGKGKKEVN